MTEGGRVRALQLQAIPGVGVKVPKMCAVCCGIGKRYVIARSSPVPSSLNFWAQAPTLSLTKRNAVSNGAKRFRPYICTLELAHLILRAYSSSIPLGSFERARACSLTHQGRIVEQVSFTRKTHPRAVCFVELSSCLH